MLKATNFTKNNLQELFQTNFLESVTTYTFDDCFIGRLMRRQLTGLYFNGRELIKMRTSLLAVREIYPIKF